MSLSVSGVYSGLLHKVFPRVEIEAPELLVSPMLEKIPAPPGSEVSLLRSLMSCGPIALVKVRPPGALGPFLGGIAEQLSKKNKKSSPRVETGPLAPEPPAAPGPQPQGASCGSPAPPGRLG